MIVSEAQLRAEERAAQEWLLYREQAADLRQQLQAAVELLGERAGLGPAAVNQLILDRIELNRKKEA